MNSGSRPMPANRATALASFESPAPTMPNAYRAELQIKTIVAAPSAERRGAEYPTKNQAQKSPITPNTVQLGIRRVRTSLAAAIARTRQRSRVVAHSPMSVSGGIRHGAVRLIRFETANHL